MVTAPTDADLSTFFSNHQGETIDVPEATYSETDPIPVGTNTVANFDWTTIDPGLGNRLVFDCSGTGWKIGGNCRILQSPSTFVRFVVYGQGQFGDSTGRIVVDGYGDPNATNHDQTIQQGDMTFAFDAGSGRITVMNVSHPGVTPINVDAGNAWTLADRDGINEFIGCDFRQMGDNGHYSAITSEVIARDCYFKNINVGALRTRAQQGTTMENTNVVYDQGLNQQGWGSGRFGAALTSTHYGNGAGPYHLKNVHMIIKADAPADFVREIDGGGDLTVEDCQWTEYPGGIDPDMNTTFVGDNGGNPSDFDGPYPFGGGLGTSIHEVWKHSTEKHIVLTSGDSTVKTYTIDVDGTVSAGQRADTGSGDSVTDNGDGTFTISGDMGVGADDYYIDGCVTNASFSSGITMMVNGWAFPTSALEGAGCLKSVLNTVNGVRTTTASGVRDSS